MAIESEKYAGLPKNNQWRSLREEKIADGIAIRWYRTQIEPSYLSGFEHPAVLVHPIGDAFAAYLNGQQVAQVGRFIESARQYDGSKASTLPLLISFEKDDLNGAEPLTLAFRLLTYTSNPSGMPPQIVFGELLDLNQSLNRYRFAIWLRDGALVLTVLVGALFSTLLLWERQKYDNNRWLPWFLWLGLPSSFFFSLPARDLGIVTPDLVWLSELLPYFFFGFLHVATAFGVRLGIWIIANLGGYYLTILMAWVLDLQLLSFVFATNLAYVFVLISVVALLLKLVPHLKNPSKVSIWNFIALALAGFSIFVYLAAGPHIPSAFDPLYLGPIGVILSFLLAMADDSRRTQRDLARMTGKILTVQDEERERLAKTLHDDLSHRVASVRLRLESLIYGNNHISKDDLSKSVDELVSVGMEISGTVENLRPATLSAITFIDMINHATDRWIGVSDAEILLDIDCDGDLNDQKKIQVLRIYQEALYNAIRHANAKTIKVVVRVGETDGWFNIRDDGQGFDIARTPSGVGLTSIKERAELIEAKLTVNSTPGDGTTVGLEFKIP